MENQFSARWLAAGSQPSRPSTEQRWTAQNPREKLRQKHFPNVPLITHTGKTVKFYDDLVRDKKVVINLMYTVCSNICSPATRNILEARHQLGEFGKGVHFYSISLTPLEDDPAALRAYMQSFGIGAGWTFLTGSPDHVDQVRQGLGFLGRNQSPQEDADLSNHSGMLRIGNEARMGWGHASALTSGRAIARMIRFELV